MGGARALFLLWLGMIIFYNRAVYPVVRLFAHVESYMRRPTNVSFSKLHAELRLLQTFFLQVRRSPHKTPSTEMNGVTDMLVFTATNASAKTVRCLIVLLLHGDQHVCGSRRLLGCLG